MHHMPSGAVKNGTKIDLRNSRNNGHFWAKAALVKNTNLKFSECFFEEKASILQKKQEYITWIYGRNMRVPSKCKSINALKLIIVQDIKSDKQRKQALKISLCFLGIRLAYRQFVGFYQKPSSFSKQLLLVNSLDNLGGPLCAIGRFLG